MLTNTIKAQQEAQLNSGVFGLEFLNSTNAKMLDCDFLLIILYHCKMIS